MAGENEDMGGNFPINTLCREERCVRKRPRLDQGILLPRGNLTRGPEPLLITNRSFMFTM